MRPRSHHDLLVRLGSNAEVGRALDVSRFTVSGWRTRGIPPKHWLAMVRLARSQGVRVTVEELEAGAPGASRRLAA